jgi:putative ABC transport system permease protein
VAVALAARRYLTRHLDGCAIMRCLGASQGLILRLHVQQFVALGLAASLMGCALGFAGQIVLAAMLKPLVGVELPLPGLVPVLQGFVAGFVLLLGFAIPPLVALRKVPTLRVLRRDLGVPDTAGITGYAVGIAALAGLILWEAQDRGAYVLSGAVSHGRCALSPGADARSLTSETAGTSGAGSRTCRHRSPPSQVVASAWNHGACLLTLVRGDLLASWKKSLPPDAPNRFLVNIQPDQLDAVRAFFRDSGLQPPELYPMIRGRLISLNGRPLSSADFADDRAKRLIDREFNLSSAAYAADNVTLWGAGGATIERPACSGGRDNAGHQAGRPTRL